MYSDEGGPVVQNKKPRKKRDPVRFEPKIIEARNEREEKITQTEKDILTLLEKNKLDDRDAKIAIKNALLLVTARCEGN
jgi:hypothetical protein